MLLYFSENYAPDVSPALGGTGCPTRARTFDLEVEGRRVSAYNQANAARPPNGDGLGALYTATPPVLIGGKFIHSNTVAAPRQFFRLAK